MIQNKLAYTVGELAAAAGVGRTTIYEEVRAGRLIIAKMGAKTIVPVERAREWIRAHEVASAMPPRNPHGRVGGSGAADAPRKRVQP